ncbi:cupin domain-containing protein [bacterium]|nr:cupin domain-containing protein [bacterium]
MKPNDPRLPLNAFSWRQRSTYNFFQVLDHFLGRGTVIRFFGRIRYRAFKDIAKTLEKKGPGKIIDVEYREHLTESEFKNYYLKRGIPVVLKGAAKNWPCVGKWDLSYLKDVHGDDEVPVIHVVDHSKGIEKTSLRELINRLQGGDKTPYFRYYNLMARHPEHLDEIDLSFIKKYVHKSRYFESFQAFLGGPDTRTELHNAHISNFFVQIHGVKEWILYPNYFVPFIDPPSTLNGIYRTTPNRVDGKPFNPFNPDYEGYPYYQYVDGYRVVLEPGDIFYNPPFMWHTVRNRTETIGLGYRWVNFFNTIKTSPVYYLLDVLSYRPNYFKALKMTRKDANEQFLHRVKMMEKLKIKGK